MDSLLSIFDNFLGLHQICLVEHIWVNALVGLLMLLQRYLVILLVVFQRHCRMSFLGFFAEDPKVLCLRIPAGLVEVKGAACVLVEAISVDLDISVLRFCSKAYVGFLIV